MLHYRNTFHSGTKQDLVRLCTVITPVVRVLYKHHAWCHARDPYDAYTKFCGCNAIMQRQHRRAVHGDRGQPVLHGAGGASAELRAGGGHLERRRDPLHPPLRRASLLGGDGAGRGARHPPRQPGPAAGALAADLRRRQEPRPPDAPDGPQEAPHRAASARYVSYSCPRERRPNR